MTGFGLSDMWRLWQLGVVLRSPSAAVRCGTNTGVDAAGRFTADV